MILFNEDNNIDINNNLIKKTKDSQSKFKNNKNKITNATNTSSF